MDDRRDAAHARAAEPQDLVRLCTALNQAGARYVLIGGFAVLAHNAGRFTKDIDRDWRPGRHIATHGARISSFGSAPGFGTNFCVRPY